MIANVIMLRIDPAFGPCMFKVQDMTLNGKTLPLDKRKVLYANGKIMKPVEKGEGTYCPSIVFPTDDPNINIGISELERQGENTLYVRMEVVRLPMSMAQDMAEAVKRLI